MAPYTPTTWVEGITTLGPTNLNHLENGVAALSALSLDAIATANATAADISLSGHKLTSVSAIQGAASSNLTLAADTAAAGTGYVTVTTNAVERLRISNAGLSTFGVAQGIRANETSLVYSGKSGFTPSGIVQYNLFSAEAYAKGVSPAGPTSRIHGFSASIKDDAKVDDWLITGAANNGSGLVRLAVTSLGAVVGNVLSASIATGDPIGVYGVGGTTEANGQWVATVVDSTHIDLQGSAFTNAWTSGGTLTNRGAYYGFNALVWPTVDRVSLTGTAANGDDVACYTAYNRGTGLAADCFYIGRNSTNFPSSPEFLAGYSCASYVKVYAFGGNGRIATGGAFLDASTATYDSASYPIRLPNSKAIVGVSGVDGSDKPLMTLNSVDQVLFSQDIILQNVNIQLGTSTGTMIGTGSTQKIGFLGATPIARPSNTTGIRTALINYGLLASGGATPLDLNGGLLSAGGIQNNGTTTLADAQSIVVGTGTGTKIGTGTTQKLAFWNKAPIAQPTTGISEATRVGGSSTTVKIDDTYGGYTLAQLAAVIINTGLAA